MKNLIYSNFKFLAFVGTLFILATSTEMVTRKAKADELCSLNKKQINYQVRLCGEWKGKYTCTNGPISGRILFFKNRIFMYNGTHGDDGDVYYLGKTISMRDDRLQKQQPRNSLKNFPGTKERATLKATKRGSVYSLKKTREMIKKETGELVARYKNVIRFRVSSCSRCEILEWNTDGIFYVTKRKMARLQSQKCYFSR